MNTNPEEQPVAKTLPGGESGTSEPKGSSEEFADPFAMDDLLRSYDDFMSGDLGPSGYHHTFAHGRGARTKWP